MPLREEGGRLYGPGIFDMKAGHCDRRCSRSARSSRSAAPHRRIVMLWTTDEEIGSGTSRTIIEAEARESRAVLVLEPSLPGGAVKTSRKGCGEFELTVHGVAAHAGLDPGKGASAIHELARQIVALEALQDLAARHQRQCRHRSPAARGPTWSPTRPARTIDVRVPTLADAAARSRQRCSALAAAHRRGPARRQRRFRTAAARAIGGSRAAVRAGAGGGASARTRAGEGAAGGGSDGNFTAALGVPTLDGLGPQGDGAHARARARRASTTCRWRAALLAGLLQPAPR